ncbi:MAG: hypothetical protein VR72_21535 [Clostridiaceae bacterium BRH_c20a]|nr:MAG: hypothetical protein VR72_21535 [Clostridiaceae bacterium BRH_c20a]
MKITSVSQRENLVVSSEKGIKVGNEQIDFAKALDEVNHREYKEDLHKLIAEVDKMSKKLAHSCTLNDLKNYKRAVQNFLKRTIKVAYEAQDESSWDRMGRQKLYVLVKKVDENLEELSRQVLSEQTDSLNILDKLDEIRGLLVDMYL